MITMQPAILTGRSVWDQSYFPVDEHEERLRLVRAEMARRGLRVLLVFGHAARYEDLCYLTQFIPVPGWGLAVLPADGDPVLVLGHGGPREVPVTRPRTPVSDIRTLPSLGAGLRGIVSELGKEGPIGIVGAEHSLPADLHDEVLSSLGGGTCVDADDLVSGLRLSLRPREVSAVRQAAWMVREAAAAFSDAHSRGAGNAAAMVEAERTARYLGAHDFRGLVNQRDGGPLEPREGATPFRGDPAVAYLAASFLGYWADIGLTLGDAALPARAAADRCLRAMVDGARAGAPAGHVAQRAMDSLGAGYRYETSRMGFGNAVGLGLSQRPLIASGSGDAIPPNSILSLRVALTSASGLEALVSDLVLVKADGCESLLGAT